MKHVRILAGGLLVALASVVFVATAASQIQKHENPGPPPRHHIVSHHRSRARVSLRVPVRHPVEKRQVERPHQEIR